MKKSAGQLFNQLKDDVSTYLELKLKLFKLKTGERIARLIAVLSHGLILILLAFFFILFLFLALGFFLGEQLGSLSLGFSIVAGLYLVLFVIIILSRNWIQHKIINTILEALMTKNELYDEEEEQKITDSFGDMDE